MTVDEAALRALVAKWRAAQRATRRAAEDGTLSEPVRSSSRAVSEGVGLVLDDLEALLHARSTQAPAPIQEVRCAEPDCGYRTTLPAIPFYCPRCWQARGSKESER